MVQLIVDLAKKKRIRKPLGRKWMAPHETELTLVTALLHTQAAYEAAETASGPTAAEMQHIQVALVLMTLLLWSSCLA